MIPLDHLCGDDDCYEAPIVTSLSFTIGGKSVYLLSPSEPDAYPALKRKTVVTYRIAELEMCGGLYKCTMDASDGSTLVIHITVDDIYHNLFVAQEVTSMQHPLLLM